MRHQRHERGAIRGQRMRTERRQRIERAAVLLQDARKPLVVQLHPRRRVVRPVVFPGREPQQHQPHLLLARLRHQGVEKTEVEMAFHRFDLVPRDRHLHGIGVDRLDRWPHLRQHRRPAAGVVHLGAEDEVGLAVDQQLVTAVRADDLRQRRGGMGEAAAGKDGGKQRGQQAAAKERRWHQGHHESVRNGDAGRPAASTRLAAAGFSLQP